MTSDILEKVAMYNSHPKMYKSGMLRRLPLGIIVTVAAWLFLYFYVAASLHDSIVQLLYSWDIVALVRNLDADRSFPTTKGCVKYVVLQY